MLKISSEFGPWRRLAPSCIGWRLGKVSPFTVSALSRESKRMPRLGRSHAHEDALPGYRGVPKDSNSRKPMSWDPHGRSQASPKSKKPTPSQLFMEERKRYNENMRRLSEKNARRDDYARRLQDTKGSKLDDPGPIYTFQAPRVVPGDIAGLFGPDSLQNRDVCPGDFVEIRIQGKPVYGIYVQSFDQADGRFQTTSISLGDQIIDHRTADVVFRIPGYLFMDKAKAVVGDWDVDAQPSTPPAGSGKVAAEFAHQSMMHMGKFYTKFNTVYDTFWRDRKQRMLTTPEVARYVFGKEGSDSAPLTLLELYASHLYLTQDSSLLRFIPSAAVRWTGEFAMRPPQDVLLTETVIDWMRNGDDPRIHSFIQKAKMLIEGYHQGDRSNWKDITFTDSDRTLIEFVKETAFNGYNSVFTQPHLTYLPKLLRPLGAYEDIDAGTAFQFLNEIGVWSTWHNLEIKRSGIPLASSLDKEQAIIAQMGIQDPKSVQREADDTLELLMQKATSHADPASPNKGVDAAKAGRTSHNPMVLQDPTEVYKRDPCDPIRHDFGHQPVYAIDDPSASELDDAFSIEPVPVTTLTPKPSTWIHVHVADPTSILPPFHDMSLLAAERIQTTYLPEGTWPMLPRVLTEGSLSLQDDGAPKKVMTFSARMCDDSGDILEFKIRPGLVRKVVTLNYDDVDKVLSWDRVHGGESEGVRVQSSTMSSPEECAISREYYRATKGSVNTEDKSLVQSLQVLQKVSQTHQDYRLRHGAFNFSLGRPLIEITPYPLRSITEDGMQGPVDYSQWQTPHITCRLDPAFASPARLMVAEYMVIAGRVAALFSQDHHLPTLFRNQKLPDEKHKASFTEMIRNKTDAKSGMMSLVDMLPLRPYIPGAEISTTPVGHWSMGVLDGYSKVTSPLRRYSDMLSHWQYKGLLLSKHQSSSSSSASVLSSTPVFSLDTLTRLSSTIRDRERMLGMLEARSVRFWIAELLRRREAAGIPNVFDGVVLNPTKDGYNVISTLLGFQTVVKADLDEDGAFEIGSSVRFEVKNCNPQRPHLGAKHLARL